MSGPYFSSFLGSANPFKPSEWSPLNRLLVDPITGSPTGVQALNNGPHGIWTPIDVTAAQIASPTADMITDINAVYRLNVAPYTRYVSDGTALVQLGLINGTNTINGNLTITGTITPQSLDGILFADQFASIQAAINALPSTGGMVILAPSTTYTLTIGVSTTKPAVHIWAPNWGTVIKRGDTLTGDLFLFSGANTIIEGMSFDGNNTVNTTGGQSEVGVSGTNSLIRNVRVRNSNSVIHMIVAGEGSRATNCTIIGPGAALSTQRGYGIWAINHNQVMIDNCTISNTNIDGIGFDGDGSMVIGNHVFNCHYWPSNAGGHIVVYPGYNNILVADNTIKGGASNNSYGMELAGTNLTVTGNTISGTTGSGIVVDTGSGVGLLISGNTIRNSGQIASPNAGIAVQTTIVGMSILSNRIIDDQGSPTQQYAVTIPAGATDNIIIDGNDLTGNSLGAISNAATGLKQIVRDNLGIDNVLGTIASGATLTLPLNPIISLTGSATATVIAAAGCWTGRTGKFIPTGAAVFTAGATIGNTVTCVANVPVAFTFDGVKLYLG